MIRHQVNASKSQAEGLTILEIGTCAVLALLIELLTTVLLICLKVFSNLVQQVVEELVRVLTEKVTASQRRETSVSCTGHESD